MNESTRFKLSFFNLLSLQSVKDRFVPARPEPAGGNGGGDIGDSDPGGGPSTRLSLQRVLYEIHRQAKECEGRDEEAFRQAAHE